MNNYFEPETCNIELNIDSVPTKYLSESIIQKHYYEMWQFKSQHIYNRPSLTTLHQHQVTVICLIPLVIGQGKLQLCMYSDFSFI